MTSILDSIDGALADYATSKDAMRWVPEEQRDEAEAVPGDVIATIGGTGDTVMTSGAPWYPLTGARLAFDRSPGTTPAERGEARRTLAEDGRRLGEAIDELGHAIGEAFRPLLDWAKRMFHDLSRLLFPKQHRRCVTCYPSRKPKPLAVDGHEYQRRLRNRRRRRR